MKKSTHIGILAVAGLAYLSALIYMQNSFWINIETLIEFPLVPLAELLRRISLSSEFRNVIAVAIYFCICLSPCVVLAIVKNVKKSKFELEDVLIPILSGALFYALYKMINPTGYISLNSSLSMAIYSIIVVYLIFKFMRGVLKSSENQNFDFLEKLLVVINVYFVSNIVSCIFSLIAYFKEVEMLSFASSWHTQSKIFTLLIGSASCLSYVFNIVVIFVLIKLVQEFKIEKYSLACVSTSTQLTKLCVSFLIFNLSMTLVLNLLQVVLVDYLTIVSISINIPVVSIMLTVTCLILSRFIKDNQALTEDVNSFI
ncbi:MAG: hypothetical protein R3Y27_05765 [Clostridia bacterium]